MKTQSEIEALLSQWYGPEEMNKVLAMDYAALWTEFGLLTVCQFSANLSSALNGVDALLSLHESLPKRECKIDLTKKVLK